ncbi:conserved hypothetical protein [Burkholderia pseudomallei 668]|uniref:Uncharacterized protein n=1 Tax=Burkholderia pseudomallei (strain 1710b) TaxID=320372 RepID=Q3JVF6_BURP1|nr:hypothetical protein BURPS1710b_1035 [Burkholderia pseudomallei 1710b]ABN81984.1 conserved hypothetical protein [Burkholderia pseudomallei 668]
MTHDRDHLFRCAGARTASRPRCCDAVRAAPDTGAARTALHLR